jgi:hypothetical protein
LLFARTLKAHLKTVKSSRFRALKDTLFFLRFFSMIASSSSSAAAAALSSSSHHHHHHTQQRIIQNFKRKTTTTKTTTTRRQQRATKTTTTKALTGDQGIYNPPESKEEAFQQCATAIERLVNASQKKSSSNKKRAMRKQVSKRGQFLCAELPVMDDGALSTSEMALSLVFDEENTSVVYADEEAARKSAEKNGKVETFSLAEALEVEADFIASEKTGAVYLVGFGEDDVEQAVKLTKKINPSRAIVLVNAEWMHAGDGGDIYKSEIIASGKDVDSISETEKFKNQFAVVYSYLPLAIENKVFGQNAGGAIFKCVLGGAPSGTPWRILITDKDGKFSQVGAMQRRPEGEDIQNTFYNAYAATSQVNKGVGAIKSTFDKFKENLPNPFGGGG